MSLGRLRKYVDFALCLANFKINFSNISLVIIKFVTEIFLSFNGRAMELGACYDMILEMLMIRLYCLSYGCEIPQIHPRLLDNAAKILNIFLDLLHLLIFLGVVDQVLL